MHFNLSGYLAASVQIKPVDVCEQHAQRITSLKVECTVGGIDY